MRILFEINHPGHFHLFKSTIEILISRSHSVYIFAKTDYPIPQLIESKAEWNVTYTGNKGKTRFQKVAKQFYFLIQAVWFILVKKIDLCIGVSVTMPQAAFLTGKKSIIFDDDDKDVTPYFTFLSHTFATRIFCPDCIRMKSPKKKYIYYQGYHELAYLHPHVFTPDKQVLKEQNLSEDEPYFIVRFNAFKAHHDKAEYGLSNEQKKELVLHLRKYGRVLISWENKVFQDLAGEMMTVPPSRIHHLLAYAFLYVGESQTMSTEAALLGIPAIRINTFKGRLSVQNELEDRYGLLFSFLPHEFNLALEKIDELIASNAKSCWSSKRDRMLRDKINVSDLITKSILALK
jgi:uncharacterized protein